MKKLVSVGFVFLFFMIVGCTKNSKGVNDYRLYSGITGILDATTLGLNGRPQHVVQQIFLADGSLFRQNEYLFSKTFDITRCVTFVNLEDRWIKFLNYEYMYNDNNLSKIITKNDFMSSILKYDSSIINLSYLNGKLSSFRENVKTGYSDSLVSFGSIVSADDHVKISLTKNESSIEEGYETTVSDFTISLVHTSLGNKKESDEWKYNKQNLLIFHRNIKLIKDTVTTIEKTYKYTDFDKFSNWLTATEIFKKYIRVEKNTLTTIDTTINTNKIIREITYY